MLSKVEKVAPQSIMPEGNVLVIQHALGPVERAMVAVESLQNERIEPKRTIEKVKMEVAFQQTLMPEQRVNFIRPKRHDFL
jgi:hypothetical protein